MSRVLRPEHALELAQGREAQRGELILEIQAQLKEWCDSAEDMGVTSFPHGHLLHQVRHEVNSLEIEIQPYGLAARRRFQRGTKRSKRKKIFRRDDFTCHYCGWKPDKETAILRENSENGMWLTVDHIVPESEGGSNVLENLITVCADCNQKKGKKLPSLDDL